MEDATLPTELPGDLLIIAYVGPDADEFQVRLVETTEAVKVRQGRKLIDQIEKRLRVLYLVNGVPVPAEVYRDAMQTARLDGFCRTCAQAESATEDQPPPEMS